MKLKIFLVLFLCVLQQVYGSKSTKKKGRSRLMKWAKNSLIVLAANEVVNAGKPQAADPNSLACKYNVPDKNAAVMMNFVKCAKDHDFQKYMLDNSGNCPKIKEIYKQAESDGKCAFKTPKNIFDGALTRFRGEQISRAANVEMLEAYLLSYPDKGGELLEPGNPAKDYLVHCLLLELDIYIKNDFDFFQFTSMLELTKLAYPNDTRKAVAMAVFRYDDVNVEHAKKLFEVTKIAFSDDAVKAVEIALQLQSEYLYKDVNVEHAKKLFELTKLAYAPDNAKYAVVMALDSKYKNANVKNAKKLFKLTKLAFPNDKRKAVEMALENLYREVNADNAKQLLELTKLAFPDDTAEAVVMAIESEYKDINIEHVMRLFELTKPAFPNDTHAAVVMALDSEYKDVDIENAKQVLKLTKFAFPDETDTAVAMALRKEFQVVNVEHVNKLFEFTKLAFPKDTRMQFVIALHLQSEYKQEEVNVENAKRVLELTKLAYPDMEMAVNEALEPKYDDVNVDKVNEKYQKLKSSWSWYLSSEQSIMREALKMTYPEVLKEDF